MTLGRNLQREVRGVLYTRHNGDVHDPLLEQYLHRLPDFPGLTDRHKILYYLTTVRPVPLTLDAAGKKFGVSRTRAQQLARKYHRTLLRGKTAYESRSHVEQQRALMRHDCKDKIPFGLVMKKVLVSLHQAEFVP